MKYKCVNTYMAFNSPTSIQTKLIQKIAANSNTNITSILYNEQT